MNVVMLSNFFNHHQSALSNALWNYSDITYRFIETQQIPQERTKMGYRQNYPQKYVLRTYESKKQEIRCVERLNRAETVIAGSAPESMVRQRIKAGKLLFRYSERPLKHGPEPLKYLPRLMRWHYRNPPGKPIYMLCASAFTAGDYRKFGLFKDHCYKWGYFPEARQHPNSDDLFLNKTKTRLLWCGRFLEWKHPDDALTVARRLKEAGVSFTLKMIGTGERENCLRQTIQAEGLQDCVELTGPMPPEQVRDCMEKAGIFLFTSDRQEGWGAVLNEAMNSGCAVVASDAIGSVPYLVKDRENGLVYHSGRVDELFEKVKWLLEHPEEQRCLGENACRTITELWNAEVAAERFIQLAQAILDGDPSPDLFREGPCSRAEVIREDWYTG